MPGMPGLGPAMSPRTVRVGDEGARRRVALHRARADDAALRGALRGAEVEFQRPRRASTSTRPRRNERQPAHAH